MHRAPTHDQAVRLDEAFGTSGTFGRLEARLRGVPFSAGFRPFHPYEAEARVLRMFEHTLVPGLFQTEAYARAVTEAYPETSAEDVNERVVARMARQVILDREDPPRLWVVLDQNVLTRNVGGPKVMGEQLARLASCPLAGARARLDSHIAGMQANAAAARLLGSACPGQ